MLTFAHDDAVAYRYPTIRAGINPAIRLTNGTSPLGLLDWYRETNKGPEASRAQVSRRSPH